MVASAGARKPRGRVLPQQNDQRVTTPEPAADPFDDRILQLLAIAKRTFGEKGFAATTMDDIASAAGLRERRDQPARPDRADHRHARALPAWRDRKSVV